MAEKQRRQPACLRQIIPEFQKVAIARACPFYWRHQRINRPGPEPGSVNDQPECRQVPAQGRDGTARSGQSCINETRQGSKRCPVPLHRAECRPELG